MTVLVHVWDDANIHLACPKIPFNVCFYVVWLDPTKKLCSGLMWVQGLHLLHVLRHHGNPLLRRLLFEQRCGNVLR